ncbi:unnamed protein product [Orchesella dallaii]|uniref:G-protein coupled receptors family 1 profile domain-containing protein n=1 Tax=Orchesella dallaii TaxID=48710 RepID=A0ABP1RJ89_9HEXA
MASKFEGGSRKAKDGLGFGHFGHHQHHRPRRRAVIFSLTLRILLVLLATGASSASLASASHSNEKLLGSNLLDQNTNENVPSSAEPYLLSRHFKRAAGNTNGNNDNNNNSDSSEQCPHQCTCEGLGEKGNPSSPLPLPTITCTRQNLTTLPTRIPASIKKLDLSWNNISKVHGSNLGHLQNLEVLILASNELERVDASAFSNLTRLKSLSLAKNLLDQIPNPESLPKSLEILELEHNRISRVEGRVLVNNGRLQALNLGNNLIEFIANDAFQSLTSLVMLQLNDNKLTEVPMAISKLPRLKELSLANNRITRIDIPFHEIIPQIVFLQVRGNPIHTIHSEGFSHLHHLEKLILSDVKNLTDFPILNGTNSLEILRIDRCSLQKVPDDLCSFTPNLKSLDLKANHLTRLPLLSQCIELKILDLGSNQIEDFGEDSFQNLTQLHDLHASKNKVGRIDSSTFRGLLNLRNLDLSYNQIDYIHPDAFLHTRQLQDVNLGNNLFADLPPAGLERVVQLKAFNNPNLREFPGPEYFPSVRRLVLSYAYHCCQFMASAGQSSSGPKHFLEDENSFQESILYPTEKEFGNALGALNLSDFWPGIFNFSNKAGLSDFWTKQFPDPDIPTGASFADENGGSDDIFAVKFRPPKPNEISCRPLPGPFLPCTDLFDWWTLRCGVWIVFLLALMGNGTVVFVLIFARTKMDVPRFLVCNLAVADFFMGVYLGFLAVVDAATLGEFRRFAITWQLSSACQIAGFMGVLSSELSVFTLAVITMERHYAITHAMHLNKRLSLRHASYIMVIGWIFALIMAILPLFGISDYRKFAVCLPFETEDTASLGYVVFLMFANGVAFTILMGCYLKMYCSIRGSQAWNSNDTRIAKRMALLVFTDLLCWFPIAFFSLTAIFGLQLVSLEEAKVFTVFILPLNSCCNPFLYAILTKQFKKDCVLICKAIEESRVTRGIGRCRHSSNFSNRQTAPNTGSLTEKSSKDGQPCICHSGLHPNGGDVNGNAKYRLIKSPERLRQMGPVGRFFSRYILCHDPSKANTRQKEEDYRMRNVRRYLYNTAQTNYPPDAEKHQRHASVSSDNFSSSRSDSWRVQNRCGIPLRMIEPRRRNSWAVTRKPSQDSNLSSSRNDSSATSNSTATWRLSRSSVSSDAASHSGGGKSSFKRISTGGAAGGGGPPQVTSGLVSNSMSGSGAGNTGVISPGIASIPRPKTLPNPGAVAVVAAAASAVATGSAAAGGTGGDLSPPPPLLMHPILATNSEDDDEHDHMAVLTMSNTIQNQNPLVLSQPMGASPTRPSKLEAIGGGLLKKKVGTGVGGGGGKKKKKKRVKIKKAKEVIIQPPPSEIDNDDEIDDEEASAKIATNRPRLVRQSAFFSDEVVIEPEVCPVHGPLNPGTYDDEDEDGEEVSDLDEMDEEDDDDEEEEEGEEPQSQGGGRAEERSGGGGGGGEEEDEYDIEDPTSPILRKQNPPQSNQIAGIALVIVPRRLSTISSRETIASLRSRGGDDNHEQQQPFILKPSGSSNSINNPGSSPTHHSHLIHPQSHSSSSSPTALLLPAGMAHFGRRKMSEQPVKFYVVPATTGLLNSAKWHSMSCVDSAENGNNASHHQRSTSTSPQHSHGGASHPPQSSLNAPSSPSASLRSQQQHSRSHSPRAFPRHSEQHRLSTSIVEAVELEEVPVHDDSVGETRPLFGAGERRVSFQLPGIQLPSSNSSNVISSLEGGNQSHNSPGGGQNSPS